jgi:hypothetical protein
MNEPPWLEFLYNALRSEHGTVLNVSDFEKCRAKLYAARRTANDPALASLSIVQSPSSPTELWIVKKGNADGSSEEHRTA